MKSLFRLFPFRKPDVVVGRPQRTRMVLDGIEGKYSLYAVGDIHGCLKELNEIEARIRNDVRLRQRLGIVVYLGDYVDRGPQSAGVLDHFCQGPPHEFRRLPLCGNHDDMFLDFLRDPRKHLDWLEMGGAETLQSYSVNIERLRSRRGGLSGLREAIDEHIPPQHVTFLENLDVSARIGNFLFVHAGIRPGRPLDQQTDQDLMWIREPFLSKGPGLPLTVVHGHTMTVDPVFGNQRIGIDTGAYMTGKLSAVRIFDNICEVL